MRLSDIGKKIKESDSFDKMPRSANPDMEATEALNKMIFEMHTTMQAANRLMQKLKRNDIDEAMKPGTSPWGGDPKKLAKRPGMKGSPTIPFSELVQDTIKTHGLKWSFDYYVRKGGLPPRQFRIFAGI